MNTAFHCRECGKRFKRAGDRAAAMCPKCGRNVYSLTETNASASFFLHRYREPVAFGHDRKTGRPLAIDKKGRKFDPGETRYDLDHDPHGWKATDKIPPKRTYHI